MLVSVEANVPLKVTPTIGEAVVVVVVVVVMSVVVVVVVMSVGAKV